MLNKIFRMPNTRKQIENREKKMTGTLVLISLSYLLFVGPIYCCSIFGIIDIPYLICFILYWLQVSLYFIINWLIFNDMNFYSIAPILSYMLQEVNNIEKHISYSLEDVYHVSLKETQQEGAEGNWMQYSSHPQLHLIILLRLKVYKTII